MGGIKEIGVIVSCDKCAKDVQVNDPAHVSFYKAHASRTDATRKMFVSLAMDMADGKENKTSYEWLCPACVEVISDALRGRVQQTDEDGVEASAAITAPKRRGRPPKITATVTVTKATAAPTAAAEPETEIPDRDQGPGIEPPARSEESSVDDNELFD